MVPVLLDVRGPGGHALVVLEACATDGIGDLLAEEQAPGGAADQAPPGTGGLVTPLSRTRMLPASEERRWAGPPEEGRPNAQCGAQYRRVLGSVLTIPQRAFMRRSTAR